MHIPFCASRCDYCDFATWTDRAHLVDDYVDACVADLGARAPEPSRPATSVFFGGGTPSLLPADRLLRILAAIPRADGAEVTVECNPDSVDAAKLAAYRAAGVTRVSFGVQSMRAPVLAALGRTHDPANVERAVGWARQAGFTTFNLDLIFGTPGETLDDWRATLDAVLALDPPHVSAYALTVEPATPLGRRVAAGARPPDDDDQATKYEIADERFAAAGLEWYEVSNWARPGHECRHNLLYWAQGEYLAIGCAAHGHTTAEERSPYRGPGPGGGASTDQEAEERSPYRGPGPGGGASTDQEAQERPGRPGPRCAGAGGTSAPPSATSSASGPAARPRPAPSTSTGPPGRRSADPGPADPVGRAGPAGRGRRRRRPPGRRAARRAARDRRASGRPDPPGPPPGRGRDRPDPARPVAGGPGRPAGARSLGARGRSGGAPGWHSVHSSASGCEPSGSRP